LTLDLEQQEMVFAAYQKSSEEEDDSDSDEDAFAGL
jgi:hypothetical protein